MKHVDHLHCEGWTETEVLNDTKVLLDLQDEAEYNLIKNPEAALLVHCSAGVGRTGTFIGLFKLIRDYRNRKVSQAPGQVRSRLYLYNCNPRQTSWIRLRPCWQ